ncbi:site-specific DNA-methyltransferase [Candidatus Woesearchaeota archaeon]|nr:site-specific DNA-methyltransferase [Candidatus Woesearchaeota archaeon]
MKTTHKIIYDDAREMKEIKSESIDLMITSPPYPMIQMWDEMFSLQNPEIANALKEEDGQRAFELMHKELDKVWKEVYRVLKFGGIACINIGDATRSLNAKFQIYMSHARILNYCLSLGFNALPEILWIKETNKPDKFMGSGMLPVGAYVSLEHEHILILRKENKREFKNPEEILNRQKSAFFWEERNIWFSDKWKDINGVFQKLNYVKVRERSAAYPIELTYRLISMFSVQGDTILDPYLGTGTTTLGAIASGRNSIGYEIDANFKEIIEERIKEMKEIANLYISERIEKHREFMKKIAEIKGEPKYWNKNYNLPVVSLQETKILFPFVEKIVKIHEDLFQIDHTTEVLKYPQQSRLSFFHKIPS